MCNIKLFFGIIVAVLFPESKAASRNKANSTPLPVSYLKNVINNILSNPVSFTTHHPSITVHHLCTPLFKQFDRFQNSGKQINRLKTGRDNRHLKLTGYRLVLLKAHDGTDMARRKKTLNPVTG